MFKISLRQITTAAMLAALSIIFERLIPITPASNTLDIRITFGNIPLILSGILVSPVIGGICGVVSDVAGCFISGYAPFPILMAAPFVTGFLPGLVFRAVDNSLIKNKSLVCQSFALILSILLSHIVSSFIITTYGLSVMRGVAFAPMFISRLPSMTIGVLIDTVAVCILYTPLKKALKNI